MATYYCKLDAAFCDRTGTDPSSNRYTGPGGLQAAIRGTGSATALAPGDVLYLQGTGRLDRLVKLALDKDVVAAGWQVEHTVTSRAGGEEQWQGRICETSVGGDETVILVQLHSGDYTSIDIENDAVDNDSISDFANINSKACEGVIVDGNDGTPDSGTPIRIVGVNGSWAEDGTYATLDGRGQSTNCISVQCAGWEWRNIEFDEASSDNAAPSGGNRTRLAFINCYSHDAGGHGFGHESTYFTSPLFVGCRVESNGDYGIHQVSYATVINSVVKDNTSGGIRATGVGGHIHGCLIHNNGGYGVLAYANPTCISHCVLDGHTSYGVYASDACLVCFSSITNNNYGLYGSTATIHDLWNYFDGNTNDTGGSLVISTWKGSSTQLTGGQQGYEDRDNDKFDRVPGATGYRREVDIGGGNHVRATCGLPTILKRQLGRI